MLRGHDFHQDDRVSNHEYKAQIMQMSGFAMGFGLEMAARPTGPQPDGGAAITATIAPGLSALNDSQTPADGYSSGTYSSPAGSIVSVIETYLVNGAVQGAAADLGAGDTVQVSVQVTDSAANSQAFTTALVTVTAVGSSATLTISALRGSDQVAPEGIWFEAMPAGFDVSAPTGGDIYDPTFHDILYVWAFDDAGSFTAPTKILTAWDDRNKGYGRQVTHVFNGPGTYAVTCTAYDRSGQIAVANYALTVKDPAMEWAGANTICVALDSNYAGAPAGAQTFSTMGAAESAYKALQGGGRMLLKANGDDYTFADPRVRNAYPNFHLGAFGAGARPNITDRIWLNDMASVKDATIWGVDFNHGWDSTTETGTKTDGITINGTRHVTISDCIFDGCDKGLYFHSITSGTIILQNCDITNWRDYGTLLSVKGTTRVGWKGCAIHQHVDALGSGVTTNVNNKHTPMRWAGDDDTRLYLGACDLFSAHGRTGGNPPDHQPAFRTSGGSNGMFINMERCSFEGGINQLAITDTAASRACLATNVCIDKAVLVGNHTTQHNLELGLGAFTMKNFVIIQPDTPQDTSWRGIVVYNDNRDNTNNRTEPVKFFNGSLVNLLSDANDPGVEAAPWFAIDTPNGRFGFDNPTEENLIVHQPNSSSMPDTDEAPLLTTELWAARYKGRQYAGSSLDTSYKPPAGTVALYGAAPGSAAENDATSGVTALDDIHGNTRGATPSRGPV